MNFAPWLLSATLAVALGGAARAASTPLPNDPRIPINAVNTPGDATATFVINSPGSYYLEDHVVGEAGKDGIRVGSHDVKIDLMGFQLRGVAGSRHGITESQHLLHVDIRNGLISNWTDTGIHFPLSSNIELRDLGFRFTTVGAILLGENSVVERCSARHGMENGIAAGFGATISQCQVSIVIDTGILVGPSSIVRDCVVRNGRVGIAATSGSIVRNCTVTNNAFGIIAADALVVDSHVSANHIGVHLAKGTLRGCEVLGSGSHGVEISAAGTLVVGNRIASNGGDGIRAQAGARIEENDVRSHSQGAGIRTFGTGSVVVKNTLFANSIAVVVPNFGNFLGPLVSVNAAFGRDDPWANIIGN